MAKVFLFLGRFPIHELFHCNGRIAKLVLDNDSFRQLLEIHRRADRRGSMASQRHLNRRYPPWALSTDEFRNLSPPFRLVYQSVDSFVYSAPFRFLSGASPSSDAFFHFPAFLRTLFRLFVNFLRQQDESIVRRIFVPPFLLVDIPTDENLMR